MQAKESVSHAVELGEKAIGMTEWDLAYDALKAVESDLPAEGLKYLAEAAWWIGRPDEAFVASETAFQRFETLGDHIAAGKQAWLLSLDYHSAGQHSLAEAWHSKALRYLGDAEGSADEALFLYLQAQAAAGEAEWDSGRKILVRVVELAERYDDKTLAARGRMLQGMMDIESGEVDRGMMLLGEATASVGAGAVDPKTAGVLMCNMISTCWDMADFAGAAEWTENAQRWFERNDVPGYPGICRVRRAEIRTLRGDWTLAETELHIATDELQRYRIAGYVGEAKYALGEIEFRRGNLDEAVAYFREANELGRDPLPGYALVLARRGDRDAAIESLQRSLTRRTERMQQSRVLLPLVDLLIAAGRISEATQAAAELEELAKQCGTGAMRGWAEMAAAACLEAEDALDDAVEKLDAAAEIWDRLDVPYELASTRARRAQLRYQVGDKAGADLDMEAAYSIFERLGAKLDIERLRDLNHTSDRVAPEVRAIVVTDIVGSTRLAEAMGDTAWAKLLSWHDRTLTALIDEHNGETIDRTGDGYLATFQEVSSAAACAIAIQRRLEDQRSKQGFAPSVRIGVHAASISEVDGSPAGAEVHRAARIGSLAIEDEIVISRAAADSLGAMIEVGDWRSESIKGFDDPVEVATLPWRTT